MRVTASARCGAVLRSLSSEDDFEQCLDLQRLTWGSDFRELVPPTILRISQKVGGVVAGAFEGAELLAFVYGLSGVRDGQLAHWSHMLAAKPEHQGRGLGRDLKLFQRDVLRELSIGVMYWTYDPLVARNANLNLQSLRARPVEYVQDMYGSDTGSELHDGLGTDRFIVRWLLEQSDLPEESTAVGEVPAGAEATTCGYATQGRIWIEIPDDIGRLKREDFPAALAWRSRTREALSAQLADGNECLGLLRSESSKSSGSRYFYVFRSQEGAP